MEDYYSAQQQYARQRTNAYTPEEQMLARMIWNEQRNQGRDAMVAAAWSVINRRDDTTYFDYVNTIQAVLEDTRHGDQYHGYPGTDPLPVIERMGSGPGFREAPNKLNDRELWFEALDIARQVINGCIDDPTKGYLWFGNGESTRQSMAAQEASNPEEFDYFLIPGTDLYFSSLPYH
jgi:spore germination cell wall hydrolase CwlJ-like protein